MAERRFDTDAELDQLLRAAVELETDEARMAAAVRRRIAADGINSSRPWPLVASPWYRVAATCVVVLAVAAGYGLAGMLTPSEDEVWIALTFGDPSAIDATLTPSSLNGSF